MSAEPARDEGQGIAVALNRTVIDDAILATAVSARGEVCLDGATATAQAALAPPEPWSALTTRGLYARDRITLRSARMPGQLGLTEARLSSPDGIHCASAAPP